MNAPYLKCQALGHHYGGETLFAGVDLVLRPGDRIGLVGPNGAGKTTLLRLLAGQFTPASGTVLRAARVGWSGTLVADPGQTVGGYLSDGLGEIAELASRLRALEAELAAGRDGALAEFGEVQERWLTLRGWTAAHRIAATRHRLGIAHLPDHAAVGQVSGGELGRLTLARLLLERPDVLLLDEPTNHLDEAGAQWLTDHLAGFPGAVMAASHDRAFLDRVVHVVLELDGLTPEPGFYQGGYTAYRAEKARRWQRRLGDFEAQEKYRIRLEADIDRTKSQALATELGTRNDRLRRYAKKVASKAKARERRLERQMQSVRWLAEPQTRPPLVLAFPDAPAPAGQPVVRAAGLTVRFGGRVVLADVSLQVSDGERILVSGVNGSGKTTLLRALSGRLVPDMGTVGVSRTPGLLPQRQDSLPRAATVLDYFRSGVPVYADDAERLLDAHQFGPATWRLPLGQLSDGEIRRLMLAMLVNSGADLLVLDEPTNYLDFDALDVAEEALRQYRGTVLMATHDRYFAERVGFSRQWIVGEGAVTEAIARP